MPLPTVRAKPKPHEPTRMTPAANPPDPSRPRLLAGLSLAALLAASVAVAFSCGGCSKPPPPVQESTDTVKGDPWKAAAVRLKKETDLVATKTALSALTADVSLQEGQKLPALSDEGFAALAALVPLSPADREEIRGAAF